MAEQLVLTTPVTATTTSWQVVFTSFDRWSLTAIFQALSDTGIRIQAIYPTPAPDENPTQPTGDAVMRGLNKSNNSVKSMQKRILEQLAADGYLGAGTVTGTPE